METYNKEEWKLLFAFDGLTFVHLDLKEHIEDKYLGCPFCRVKGECVHNMSKLIFRASIFKSAVYDITDCDFEFRDRNMGVNYQIVWVKNLSFSNNPLQSFLKIMDDLLEKFMSITIPKLDKDRLRAIYLECCSGREVKYIFKDENSMKCSKDARLNCMLPRGE